MYALIFRELGDVLRACSSLCYRLIWAGLTSLALGAESFLGSLLVCALVSIQFLIGCQGENDLSRRTIRPVTLQVLPRGTLAFQSDREGNWDIYLIEPNGSSLLRLTTAESADLNPAWAPDGEHIVFSSERTGGGDIYTMEANGKRIRRLTDDPAYEGAPDWSPDGKWIVFEGERHGPAEIYRVEVATGEVQRITNSPTRKLGPAFSPDGDYIAYMERAVKGWRVVVLDWEKGVTTKVSGGGGACRPTWSPSGDFLAYVSTAETDKADLWFYEIGRESTWRVQTRPNAHNYDPSFSSDGTVLVFASTIVRGQNKQWDLFLTDLNGKQVRNLTDSKWNERFPTWRPETGGNIGTLGNKEAGK